MHSALITPERIITLTSGEKTGALTELVDLLVTIPEVEDREELLKAILEREADLSTAMGFGFAVPHAKIVSVREFVMAIGLTREGIEFDAIDGKPVHLIVMIAGPVDRQRRYLQLLRQITQILRDSELRERIMASCEPQVAFEIFSAIH